MSTVWSRPSPAAVPRRIDSDELHGAAADVGARAIAADVSRTPKVDAMVARAVDETGRIDVLVNNAGILRDRIVWKLTDDDWDAVLDVHTGGTFRCTRACVPHFRAQQYGRVINVTSYKGLRGNSGQANYATAKAGIIGFTKTVAKELAHFGATVNAISPKAADTHGRLDSVGTTRRTGGRDPDGPLRTTR